MIFLTDNFTESQRARAIPGAIFEDRTWWLLDEPDPSDARIALRLFPRLHGEYPQLSDIARQDTQDTRPIDCATAHWEKHYADRDLADDPWQRVLAALERL